MKKTIVKYVLFAVIFLNIQGCNEKDLPIVTPTTRSGEVNTVKMAMEWVKKDDNPWMSEGKILKPEFRKKWRRTCTISNIKHEYSVRYCEDVTGYMVSFDRVCDDGHEEYRRVSLFPAKKVGKQWVYYRDLLKKHKNNADFKAEYDKIELLTCPDGSEPELSVMRLLFLPDGSIQKGKRKGSLVFEGFE